MIVFPLRRSVGLRAATASSRLATLPMLVRSRPSRTRWTISLSGARSDSTTKSHIEGTPTELPLGIELSGYRIIQEALTNALKYAGDARATVLIRYGNDSLELEIVDDGTGAPARVTSGGHGLVGMKERVALYGGKLDAGHRP